MYESTAGMRRRMKSWTTTKWDSWHHTHMQQTPAEIFKSDLQLMFVSLSTQLDLKLMSTRVQLHPFFSWFRPTRKSPWTQVETKKASGLWTSYFNAPDACSYADISFFARTWAQGGVFLFASCTGCKATASHHALLFQMALNEWREAKNIQRFLPQVRRTSLLFVCNGRQTQTHCFWWCFCFVSVFKYAQGQCYVRHF